MILRIAAWLSMRTLKEGPNILPQIPQLATTKIFRICSLSERLRCEQTNLIHYSRVLGSARVIVVSHSIQTAWLQLSVERTSLTI